MAQLEDNFLKLVGHVEELSRARTPSPGPVSQTSSAHALPAAMPLSPLHAFGYMPTFPIPYMTQNTYPSPNSLYTSAVWHSPSAQAIEPSTSSSAQSQLGAVDIAQIRSLLQDFESVDILDTSAILEDEWHSIPSRERRKADLIVSTSQFRSWMVGSGSNELLVHGEFRRPQSFSAPVSAISVFCATLTQTLRAQDQKHIVLVFYCGSHAERDDQHRGARGMIRSFAAQLARYPSFDTVTQKNGLDGLEPQKLETTIKGGKISSICQLFRGLVSLLPEQATLICLIDGISHYETDGFEDEMLECLDFLLDMVRKANKVAGMKLLVSSPTVTDLVQLKFKDDDSSFISLAEIRDLGQGLGLSQLKDLSDSDESSPASESSESLDE